MSNLVNALMQCEEYRNYIAQKENLSRYPDLKRDVLRLREINSRMQEVAGNDEEDRLNDEFERLMNEPMVREFMQAETDYCRMFQNLRAMMASELEL